MADKQPDESKPFGKGGRPRLPDSEKLDARLSVRMTDDERLRAESDARTAGLSLAEFARQKITRGRVRPSRSRADAQLVSELNRSGVNIHQIARAVHFKQPVLDDEITAVLKRHQLILDRIAAAYDA